MNQPFECACECRLGLIWVSADEVDDVTVVMRGLLIHGARTVMTHSQAPPEWARQVAERRPKNSEEGTGQQKPSGPAGFGLHQRPDIKLQREPVDHHVENRLALGRRPYKFQTPVRFKAPHHLRVTGLMFR
jgi:hypothetical protein